MGGGGMGCRVWAKFDIREEIENVEPIRIEVRYWLEHGRPAYLVGPPGKCRPGEGFETEIEKVWALGEDGNPIPFDFTASDWDEIYWWVNYHAEEYEVSF
jgi:hypothetical protein